MPGVDGIGQRRLVDEPAARGVDDDDARLRARELIGADEPLGFRGLRQVDRNEVRALEQFVEGDEFDAELGCAGRGDVGVVGDDPGLERGQPRGDQLTDPAEPDDADRLAEDLEPLNSLRCQVCSRRVWSAAGIWRAAESISATACSAAVWMFEVGALTTRTPRSVAAGTSTLSRPTPRVRRS